MGSLTSRPELPQAQQPVIYTLPSTAPPAAVTPPAPADSNAPGPAPTDDEVAAQAREQSLLQRSRGRLGTVLTGLNGILSQAVSPGARKTLLGE